MIRLIILFMIISLNLFSQEKKGKTHNHLKQNKIKTVKQMKHFYNKPSYKDRQDNNGTAYKFKYYLRLMRNNGDGFKINNKDYIKLNKSKGLL